MKTNTIFCQQVYRLVKQVPKGKVTTYKAIACTLHTRAYRAVGQALARNPGMPSVPCHRVIRSDGTIGGFSGSISGIKVQKKLKLLQQEGISIKGSSIKHLLFTRFKS